MNLKRKRPGDALQRISGAEIESPMNKTSCPDTYATCRDLQTRFLRRRCGLDDRTAGLVAGFCFGEERE